MKLAAILILELAGTAMAGPQSVSLPPDEENRVISVAEKVRTAIQTGDVNALIGFLSRKEGLACTDTHVAFGDVRESLRNKHSYIYLSLFDTKNFVARCGDAYSTDVVLASDKEFFEKAPNSPIEIVWVSDKKDYVTVKYEAGDYPSRKYTFHSEPAGWRIVDGLIVGDCTCG